MPAEASFMDLTCTHCGRCTTLHAERAPAGLPCPHCGERLAETAAAHQAPAPPSGRGAVSHVVAPFSFIAPSSFAAPWLAAPWLAAPWLKVSVSTLASVVIHTGLLVLCALITVNVSTGAGDGEKGEGHQVAIGALIVERLEQHDDERLDARTIRASSAGDESLDDSLSVIADIPGPTGDEFSVDDALAALAPSGGSRGGGSGGGLHEIEPISAAGGRTLDGQATFMGIQAQGRRFCIIADRSGSMFGTKIEFLKREIIETLTNMSPHARAQLVLFNTRALPYPKRQWLQPHKEKLAVEGWLRNVAAHGDTYPTPAFMQAFLLEPLPDAIFFMTDGQFDPRVVLQIRKLNSRVQQPVPIHTITFMDRSAAGMMAKIADESGGTYRHVSGMFAPAAMK